MTAGEIGARRPAGLMLARAPDALQRRARKSGLPDLRIILTISGKPEIDALVQR